MESSVCLIMTQQVLRTHPVTITVYNLLEEQYHKLFKLNGSQHCHNYVN